MVGVIVRVGVRVGVRVTVGVQVLTPQGDVAVEVAVSAAEPKGGLVGGSFLFLHAKGDRIIAHINPAIQKERMKEPPGFDDRWDSTVDTGSLYGT
jgi:hypothetical protein